MRGTNGQSDVCMLFCFCCCCSFYSFLCGNHFSTVFDTATHTHTHVHTHTHTHARTHTHTALTTTASRCGFIGKRVSRITTRNVGVSTCATDWWFNCCETFSFAVDSVKSVLTVEVMLSCSAQLSPAAHLIDNVLDVVDSCGGVFFSAPYCKVICMQGAWHMSWHCGCDVIHVDQEEGRRYYTTWGNTLSQSDLSADRHVHNQMTMPSVLQYRHSQPADNETRSLEDHL